MTRYKITIEPDEDGWWHISADDVPGARSHGQTLDRARANIKEAIALVANLPEGAEATMELEERLDLPPATDEALRQVWEARGAYALAGESLQSATEHALDVLGKEFPDLGIRDLGALLGISYQRVAQLRPGAPRGGRRTRVAS